MRGPVVEMIVMQAVWVAAISGLRRRGMELCADRASGHSIEHVMAHHTRQWWGVYDLSAALGHPPTPHMVTR